MHMLEKNVCAHLSYLVWMRRQSSSLLVTQTFSPLVRMVLLARHLHVLIEPVTDNRNKRSFGRWIGD
jgi:hypothetical protein